MVPLSLLTFLSLMPMALLGCPSGWHAADTPSRGTQCYKFYEHVAATSWAQADQYCKAVNAHLATIKDNTEASWFYEWYEEKIEADPPKQVNAWMGATATSKTSDRMFFWLDGGEVGQNGVKYVMTESATKVKYTVEESLSLWGSGEPGHYSESCAMLMSRRWYVVPSNDQNNYKEHSHQVLTDFNCGDPQRPLCQLSAHSEGYCPKGWGSISSPRSKTCTKVIKETKTWDQANARCMELEANLITIKNKVEETMVKDMMRQPQHNIASTWLGAEGTTFLNEFRFFWVDSEWLNDTYSNWGSSEPSSSGTEKCIEMKSSDGKWNDRSCGSTLPSFICQKSASAATEVCPEGWLSFASPRGLQCYKHMSHSYGTFEEAGYICEHQNYAHLLIPKNYQEHLFIKKWFEKKGINDVWFGAKYSDGQYFWKDGTPVYSTYSMFHSGAPGHPGSEDCIEWSNYQGTYPGEYWNDLGCTAHANRKVVCHISRASAGTTCRATKMKIIDKVMARLTGTDIYPETAISCHSGPEQQMYLDSSQSIENTTTVEETTGGEIMWGGSLEIGFSVEVTTGVNAGAKNEYTIGGWAAGTATWESSKSFSRTDSTSVAVATGSTKAHYFTYNIPGAILGYAYVDTYTYEADSARARVTFECSNSMKYTREIKVKLSMDSFSSVHFESLMYRITNKEKCTREHENCVRAIKKSNILTDIDQVRQDFANCVADIAVRAK